MKPFFNANIIEKNPEIIGVCHPHWRGIRSATYSLTANVFEVPEIQTLLRAKKVAEEILKYQPKKIILSGYPCGYDLLAKSLKEQRPAVRIFFLSHTPFTWYTERFDETSWLEKMLNAHKSGYIEKVGFAKEAAALYFKEKGVNAFFVMNRPGKYDKTKRIPNLKNPQIGVWGSHMWHRNLVNQVLAGLMVENSQIHMNELPEYFFIDKERVKRHGVLSKEEYIPLLRSMDINLYISFTDCFPMTVIESMSCGIPCITSDTSGIYNWSDYLKDMLVESKIDNPVAIRDRIKKVFKNYSRIKKEIAVYLPILYGKIDQSLVEFLK